MNKEKTEDEIIQLAMKHYLKHKENCRNYYKTRYHSDEEFREKHKKMSRDHYHNNKEKYAERYQQQKKFKQAERKYNYYKNLDQIDKFIELFPEDYKDYFENQE